MGTRWFPTVPAQARGTVRFHLVLTQPAEAIDLPRALVTTFPGFRAFSAEMLPTAIPASAPIHGCGSLPFALAVVCPFTFALSFALAFALALLGFLQWTLGGIVSLLMAIKAFDIGMRV